MPLSEYEKSVLEQMERALKQDDPKFANTLSKAQPRSVGRYFIAAVGLIFGMVVLILGAVNQNIVVGVIGFAVMFGAVAFAFAYSPKPRSLGVVGDDGKVRPGKTGAGRPGVRGQKRQSAFMTRMEERWDRRQQGGR